MKRTHFVLRLLFFGFIAGMPSSIRASEDSSLRSEPPLRTFDVKAVSTHSYFIDEGKVKEEDTGDQVVYFVDLPNKKVKRIAVYYAQKKKKKGENVIASGLHANAIEYAVVHYKFDFMRNQILIKALAQTQNEDGFETLVIGEDFVASSVSTKGYFTVTYYDRIDAEAMVFKKRGSYAEEDEEDGLVQVQPEHEKDDGQLTAAKWVSGKVKNFNRWRRQKVRSSYSD